MKKKVQKFIETPISRSTTGLRESLFEEMEMLRSGASNPTRARSIAMMANSILQSVQVEIEYHKYVNSAVSTGSKASSEKVIELGTNMQLAPNKQKVMG